MQNNLCILELPGDFGNLVHIIGFLVFKDIIFEGRESDRAARSFGVAVLLEELVDDFAEEHMGVSGGVYLVADKDTGDAFRVAVNVEDKF